MRNCTNFQLFSVLTKRQFFVHFFQNKKIENGAPFSIFNFGAVRVGFQTTFVEFFTEKNCWPSLWDGEKMLEKIYVQVVANPEKKL